MSLFYTGGVVTDGPHFTYKGVEYGCYTKVLFTDDFYKKVGEYVEPWKMPAKTCGYKYPWFRTLDCTIMKDGKKFWCFQGYNSVLATHRYADIDFDKDIEKIMTPVYYYEPMDLLKKRFRDGTWFWHIAKETLIYAACLLVSPIFKEWYLIWTIGLYIYLRFCYINLTQGELYNGWQN